MTVPWCAGCAAQRGPHAITPVPIEVTVRADELSPPSDALTVATYNVHGLRKRDAVRDDLAELDRVNVWCLQEFPCVDGSDFATVLPPGRWYAATIPLNPDGSDARRWESQVIASRFPLDRVEVWPLDDGGAKRRVALAARVHIAGRPVLIVNTDHEPSILAWRDGNGAQTRRLAAHLHDCGDDAVVVAGDFNRSGSVYRLVGNGAHVRRVDAALAECGLAPVGATGSTFRSGVVRARLDRIYARRVRPSASAVATAARGSDHLPVWVRFEMPPAVAISEAALAR